MDNERDACAPRRAATVAVRSDNAVKRRQRMGRTEPCLLRDVVDVQETVQCTDERVLSMVEVVVDVFRSLDGISILCGLPDDQTTGHHQEKVLMTCHILSHLGPTP